MKANNFSWYINRLLAMSPAELIQRIISSLQKTQWKYFTPSFDPHQNLDKIITPEPFGEITPEPFGEISKKSRKIF